MWEEAGNFFQKFFFSIFKNLFKKIICFDLVLKIFEFLKKKIFIVFLENF